MNKKILFTILVLFFNLNGYAELRQVGEGVDCMFYLEMSNLLYPYKLLVNVDEHAQIFFSVPGAGVAPAAIAGTDLKKIISLYELGLKWSINAKEHKLDTEKQLGLFTNIIDKRNNQIRLKFYSTKNSEFTFIKMDLSESYGQIWIKTENLNELISILKKVPDEHKKIIENLQISEKHLTFPDEK